MKRPAGDRHEVLEAGLDPVLGLDGVEGDVPGHLVASGDPTRSRIEA